MYLSSLESLDTSLGDSDHDETGCVHSTIEEVYDSTTLGEKRRMAHRRNFGRGSDSTPIKRTYKKAGKITFRTAYSQSNRTFEVHVLRAFDLAPRRDIVDINPFVRLYLVPGKKQKQDTKFQKGTKEPFINQKILFTDLEPSEFSKYKLKLKVYNHGKLKKNEVLGEVDIALSSVDVTVKETYNIDLFLQRSEVKLLNYLYLQKL